VKLEISDKSRRATTECTKGLSCLTGELKDLCPVESCVNGVLYFVKHQQQDACSQRRPFGTGYYCVCPVRKELFDRYKV